jgi:hypothetical protein
MLGGYTAGRISGAGVPVVSIECARPFHPWLSILTDIYLCHTCSCHEILRMETPGQGGLPRARIQHILAPRHQGDGWPEC